MVTKSLATKSSFTEAQLDLIKNTVAKGATNDELKLFLYTAAKCGLDPLTRQIHFVKRGNQATIQTGIDGYRVVAERKGDLAGIDDAVYDSEDGDKPKKATVTVYRMVNGQRVSFTASARWSEYAPQGTQAFMWNKMPYLMLAKCAEALALRKAFPNDLSGIYTNEEMEQADTPKEDVGPRQQAYKDGVIDRETIEVECYCTICGERGVKGNHGYYCPNYQDEVHKINGKRQWSLISKEEKEKREKEADVIEGEIEEAEEPFESSPRSKKIAQEIALEQCGVK